MLESGTPRFRRLATACTRRVARLSSALAAHQQWPQEVQAARPNSNPEAFHAKYAARLQGWNDAFATLRQGDPGITTQIDVEQFKQSVTDRVHYQRHEQTLADSRLERSCNYGIYNWFRFAAVTPIYTRPLSSRMLKNNLKQVT